MPRPISLRQKQSQFTHMVALLILQAEVLGFECTLAEAYRHPSRKGGHKTSLHRKRLAVDVNLFRNGKYLKRTEEHRELGVYWESIGGSWGGRFTPQDGNHYSLAYRGMR